MKSSGDGTRWEAAALRYVRSLVQTIREIIGADHPRAKYGLASIRYGKAPRDRSAITPKWSESSRPS